MHVTYKADYPLGRFCLDLSNTVDFIEPLSGPIPKVVLDWQVSPISNEIRPSDRGIRKLAFVFFSFEAANLNLSHCGNAWCLYIGDTLTAFSAQQPSFAPKITRA